MQAVLNLLNPCPDGDIVPVGWPDSKAAPSVVLVDTQEVTVTAPTGLATGVTWDLHAGISPYSLNPAGTISSFKGSIGAVSGPFDTTTFAGPYFALTGASGTAFAPNNTGSGGVTVAFASGYGDIAAPNMFRVVAQAMEVINTSAELYKGGMAYGYRTPTNPNPITFSAQVVPAPAATVWKHTCQTAMNLPPRNASGVVNFKNVYEGEAKDGLYVINTPAKSTNEPPCGIGANVIMIESPSESSSFAYWTDHAGPANNWNHCGGFMTGLAQGSSVVIRYRTYMEIFPTMAASQNASTLVRLAGQTVPRSPIIDEILARVLCEMPAGTCYKDNPLGEWFSKILEAVASVAPIVGTALSPIFPAAGLIGNGVGAIAGGISKATQKKKKKDLIKLR
jgi:hypothetical protein